MNLRLIYKLFLILLFLQCSSKGSRKDFALSYWSSNNNGEISFAKQMVSNWNNEFPERRVHFQPIPEGQSSEEIILAAVVGKTTPDIYANMWQGSVEFYAKSGVLVALDTLEGFLPFIRERCDSLTIKEITSTDGHIYQIPWKTNPIMVLYNEHIFDTLELDTLPYTYSKFFDASEKFKQDRNGDGHIDQWFGITSVKPIWYQRLFNYYPLYLAASNGESLIENNKAAFNNEHSIQVFTFLQEIYNKEYFSRQQQSAIADPFIGGSVATKITGPWEITYLEKFMGDDKEFSFFNIPVPDNHTGPFYTYGDPKNIVIFNTCKEPQLAWDFVKTMISREGDFFFMETTGQLPRRKELQRLPEYQTYFQEHPKLEIFARQARYVKGIDNCEKITEVLDIISQEYEACVLFNRKTPQQALYDAEKAVNILLRQN